ncbi:MAG: MinD/ParA family protein [Campylobacteraceae bacterium]|nr:MinD/ParA family protein [Campylobacteraceae bacterium]
MNIVSVLSGKGGVGKSVISANLASILAKEGYKVCLVDGDFTLGNLDIILNVKAEKTAFDFFSGIASLSETLLHISPNLHFISSHSGREILTFYSYEQKELFETELKNLNNFDFIIIDTPTGINSMVGHFVKLSDKSIVVTTPEPTSIMDSYTMMKLVLSHKDEVLHLLNFNSNSETVSKSLEQILKNNIQKEFGLEFLGSIREDKKVSLSVKSREMLCDEYSDALVTYDIKVIASNLLESFGHKGLKLESVNGIFRKLLDRI